MDHNHTNGHTTHLNNDAREGNQNILVAYRPRRIFPVDALPAEHQESAQALIDQLKPYVGELVQDPDADLESSWEELFRLDAGLSAFATERTFISKISPTGGSTPVPLIAGTTTPEAFDIRWGPELGTVRERHQVDPEIFAYWDYEAFKRAAGREHVVCGYAMEGQGVDIIDVADRLADDSSEPGKIFVKGTHNKMFAGSASLLGGQYRCLIFDQEHLNGGMWRYEGRPGMLLAQPYVPMTHEYRFFVVHGALVSGSYKEREFTPFESSEQFSTRTSTPEPYVFARQRFDEYRQLATRVASELLAEDPTLTCYTMDIAMGADGPLVVELNSMGSSGLFLANPQWAARALARGPIANLREWTANKVIDGSTTMLVKRACGGCSEPLGDLNDVEKLALLEGNELPDTHAEHCCW